jgi:hypothetical protein
LNHLVIAPEQSVFINRVVAPVDFRRNAVSFDSDASLIDETMYEILICKFTSVSVTAKILVTGLMFLPENLTESGFTRNFQRKVASASVTVCSLPSAVRTSTVTFGTSSNCCVRTVPENVRLRVCVITGGLIKHRAKTYF